MCVFYPYLYKEWNLKGQALPQFNLLLCPQVPGGDVTNKEQTISCWDNLDPKKRERGQEWQSLPVTPALSWVRKTCPDWTDALITALQPGRHCENQGKPGMHGDALSLKDRRARETTQRLRVCTALTGDPLSAPSTQTTVSWRFTALDSSGTCWHMHIPTQRYRHKTHN